MIREKIKVKADPKESKSWNSVRNACKLCAPLGASMVFKGIRGCIPMLHGSQGCATYIRRYMISHFKEPVDIASSNFSEEATIFGGGSIFAQGIDNVISQYHPEVLGIASTCLSETIGEDIPGLIHTYVTQNSGKSLPAFIHASTPSYKGTHMNGFHDTVLAVVKSLAKATHLTRSIALFPGFLSPADLRHLKEILAYYSPETILFPDYSETLDGTNWTNYQHMPEGGTSVPELESLGTARAIIELGVIFNNGITAGSWLNESFGIENYSTPIPIGIGLTDQFLDILKLITGKDTPDILHNQRGRLIDTYTDGHKYVFGKKAIVYGEEDLVISMVAFLSEIGIKTVLAASGAESGRLQAAIEQVTGEPATDTMILNSADFEQINEWAEQLNPDIIIGNSKGYYISRKLKIPLIRIGFPIHDRIGAQRILHIGYEGTMRLFDLIVNALIEYKQDHSPVGYTYI